MQLSGFVYLSPVADTSLPNVRALADPKFQVLIGILLDRGARRVFRAERLPVTSYKNSKPLLNTPPQLDRRPNSMIQRIFRVVASPSCAFLLLCRRIGFYALPAYANKITPDSHIGAIVIRVGSLIVLFLSISRVPRAMRHHFFPALMPAALFLFFYSFRLLDNMLLLGIEIAPGNIQVLQIFFSTLVASFLLAQVEHTLRDEDLTLLMSAFTFLFLLGMLLNFDQLSATAGYRLQLQKINPISLSYVCSSIIIYYIVYWGSSRRILIEFAIAFPALITIIALAQSRGMMISTVVTLIVYVLALKGTQRIFVLISLCGGALIISLYIAPEMAARMLQALERIDPNTDMSTAGRVLSFNGAWDQFLKDPVFGRYAIELQTNFYPHNIYLEALMAVGLFGGVPFGLHVALAFRASVGLIRARDKSRAQVFVALLFIRSAVGTASSGSLYGSSGFWISSFIVIAMWYWKQRRSITSVRRMLIPTNTRSRPILASGPAK